MKEGGGGTGEKIEVFIEHYKLLIGGLLLLMIVTGGAILLYRDGIQRINYSEKLSRLEGKISEIELELNQHKEKQTSGEIVSAEDQTKKQTSPDINSGQVAGVSANESSKEASGKVNINAASVNELDSLPGIGPTYAKRIIDYRTQVGGFKSIEEIKNVKGIGDKTFEKFKDKIIAN